MVPASTVFGLTRAEVVSLKEAAGSGLTVTDSDTRNEGYEVRKDLKDTKPRTWVKIYPYCNFAAGEGRLPVQGDAAALLQVRLGDRGRAGQYSPLR